MLHLSDSGLHQRAHHTKRSVSESRTLVAHGGVPIQPTISIHVSHISNNLLKINCTPSLFCAVAPRSNQQLAAESHFPDVNTLISHRNHLTAPGVSMSLMTAISDVCLRRNSCSNVPFSFEEQTLYVPCALFFLYVYCCSLLEQHWNRIRKWFVLFNLSLFSYCLRQTDMSSLFAYFTSQVIAGQYCSLFCFLPPKHLEVHCSNPREILKLMWLKTNLSIGPMAAHNIKMCSRDEVS